MLGGAGMWASAQVVKAWSSRVVPWAFFHWVKRVSAVCFSAVNCLSMAVIWASVKRAGGGFFLTRSVAEGLVLDEAAGVASAVTRGRTGDHLAPGSLFCSWGGAI